ncbi:hypothetical protein BH09VER1_BH09VER1_20480 [soil metagenome]
MAGSILHFLEALLREGPLQIGQVFVSTEFSLRNFEDAGREGLKSFFNSADAVEIAKYDDTGKYRPLKTAPNLRHGWILQLETTQEVLIALDYLYPAAIGTALAVRQEQVVPINLRETLTRQSGMYAVVKRLTDDQANDLIKKTCHEGCLRKILWLISEERPAPLVEGNSPAFPIYCVEACNLLVAAGRPVAKANPPVS